VERADVCVWGGGGLEGKKIKGKRKGKYEKRKMEIKKKKEGYYGHFTLYTIKRSCFAKRFSKMISNSPKNPLHQHNPNWS
jgi:hypothetical protein